MTDTSRDWVRYRPTLRPNLAYLVRVLLDKMVSRKYVAMLICTYPLIIRLILRPLIKKNHYTELRNASYIRAIFELSPIGRSELIRTIDKDPIASSIIVDRRVSTHYRGYHGIGDKLNADKTKNQKD